MFVLQIKKMRLIIAITMKSEHTRDSFPRSILHWYIRETVSSSRSFKFNPIQILNKINYYIFTTAYRVASHIEGHIANEITFPSKNHSNLIRIIHFYFVLKIWLNFVSIAEIFAVVQLLIFIRLVFTFCSCRTVFA